MAGPKAVRFLRKVQWPALIHPAFEEIRNSPKFPALLEPLIGTSLKQYINQINFKMPGGKIEFPWHQDVRPTPAFRDQVSNYVQTIVVVDEANVANGCLARRPGEPQAGQLESETVRERWRRSAGRRFLCRGLRGHAGRRADVYFIHGSRLVADATDRRGGRTLTDSSGHPRCDVGKWAFLEGKPVPITSDTDCHEIRYSTQES